MCSIGGAIFKKPLDRAEAERIASVLLFFGRDRGDQSSGFWLDGMQAPCKRAVPVDELLGSPTWRRIWDARKDVRIMLTHTRLPTSGGRTAKCAQPFESDGVVTVHNGHIDNPQSLESLFHFTRKTDVDSEVFARYIGRYGTRHLSKFLRNASGSAAVAAYHNGNIIAFRSGNPIWVAKMKGYGIIFGSTKEMVQYAVATLYGFYPANCKFESVPDNEVLQFTADGIVKKIDTFLSLTNYARFQSDWMEWDQAHGTRPFVNPTGRIIKTGSLKTETAHPLMRPATVEPYSQWLQGMIDERDVILIEEPIGGIVKGGEGES